MRDVTLIAVATMILAVGTAHATTLWYTETTATAGLVTYTDTTGPYPLFGDPTPHKSGGPSVQTVFAPGDPIFAGAMLNVMAITLPTLKADVYWNDKTTWANGNSIDAADLLGGGGTGDDLVNDARFTRGSLTLYDPLGVVVWTDPGGSLSWDNIYVNQQAGHDMLVRSLGVSGGYSYIYEQLRGMPIQIGIYTVEFTGYEGAYLADSTQFTVVPEPLTMLAVFTGVAGLAGYVRKRRRV
ncbi:MAG: PEP-CTERM sorting domain-containing protein [Phycisphaerae bacterium]|nr:PEP-CTERM sorting domain-containing protein [Phycisphaerae bacterium]